MKIGNKLKEIRFKITQEKINQFAEFSGDFNPIHVDEEFAKSAGLGGTIAHGAIGMAYIMKMLHSEFGRDFYENGRFIIKFISPMRPGFELRTFGEVKKISDTTIYLSIGVEKVEDSSKLIVGEAWIGTGAHSSDG